MNSGHNAVPFRSGSFLSFSLRACFSSGYLLRPFFFYSLSFLRSFRVFLFAVGENSYRRRERTALSACDLHKISILEARPEKSIDESRGARWWISSTKTGPFRFNVHGAYHKGEIVIFTARFDFAVASHILSSFHPPHSPPFSIHPRLRNFCRTSSPSTICSLLFLPLAFLAFCALLRLAPWWSRNIDQLSSWFFVNLSCSQSQSKVKYD